MCFAEDGVGDWYMKQRSEQGYRWYIYLMVVRGAWYIPEHDFGAGGRVQRTESMQRAYYTTFWSILKTKFTYDCGVQVFYSCLPQRHPSMC